MVKVENLRRGNSIFSVGPQPWRQGRSDADASKHSMPYLSFFFSICTCVLLMIRSRRCEPATSNCRQLFCTDFVIWSYTTVPVAFRLLFLCIFTNMEVQECYLPIIRGAGMPFPCVPRQFNHCCQRHERLHSQWNIQQLLKYTSLQTGLSNRSAPAMSNIAANVGQSQRSHSERVKK